MALVKVEGTSFYRDTQTMALINCDSAGRDEYMFKRNMIANQKHEINKVKEEITSIKGEMQEIKTLMLKLLEKGSNG